MRWLLTVALTGLAMPALAGDNEAEKLFRQMEKKLQNAKTVQVRFESSLMVQGIPGSIKGRLICGEGNLLRIEASVLLGAQASNATMISDGKKLFAKDTGQAAVDVQDCPKGLGAFCRGILSRVGIVGGLEPLRGKDTLKVEDVFKLADFKLGAKEKVGKAETQVVDYTVQFEGKKVLAKMWIDTQTLLPAKLDMRNQGGPAVELSETYRDYTIDGKVDAKLFEAPK